MKVSFLICIFLFQISLAGQNFRSPLDNSMELFDKNCAGKIPLLSRDASQQMVPLPVSLDNSKNKYFPPLIYQNGFNCQQVAGVSYVFAYEINRLRDIPSAEWNNMYPEHYTWNYMNNGEFYRGVSFFYSWDVLKQQGHPSRQFYPGSEQLGITGWMSGYDRYYSGMKNRLRQVYKIRVNTDEGIETLKQYMYDHLEGSSTGGVAVFGAAGYHGIENMVVIPPGLPEAGKKLQTGFLPNATHAMTLVGYNDSIRYDINGDGQFTNNLDVTGDGEVDVCDREWGAFRMANSYGNWWEDNGYCWIMYAAFGRDYDEGVPTWSPTCGVFDESVFILEPVPDYEPQLTMKVTLHHTLRNTLSVKAGISADPESAIPEHMITFPVWSSQGNKYPVNINQEDLQEMELGFDITPLLSFVEGGQPGRLFFILDSEDPYEAGSGQIGAVSFISYINGMTEIPVAETRVMIPSNGSVILSAPFQQEFSKVRITTDELPTFSPPAMADTLTATGGKKPYKWTLLNQYHSCPTDSVFPMSKGQELNPPNISVFWRQVMLPFEFPFYGKKHISAYMNAWGFVSFYPDDLPYFYLVDPEEMLRNNTLISAMYGPLLVGNELDSMWYLPSAECAVFRWSTRVKENENQSSVNFGLRLYPDGRIEYLYGDCRNQLRPFRSHSGLSAGDGINFQVWRNETLEELSGKSFLFTPQDLPESVILSPEGLLQVSGTDSSKIYDIHVKVTDDANISSYRTFTLSGNLALEAEIADQGMIRQGTPAQVRVKVENKGTVPVQGISLVLRGDDRIRITDSTEQITGLEPGEFFEGDAFVVITDSAFADRTSLRFTLTAVSSPGIIEKEIYFDFSAPDVRITEPFFSDGTDQIPEPGEVGDLLITLRNHGSAGIENAEIILESQNTLFPLHSPSVRLVESFAASDTLQMKYRIAASRNAVPGDTAGFLLTVKNGGNFEKEFPFVLTIGSSSVAILDLSDAHTSANEMVLALGQLGSSYMVFDKIPPELGDYSVIFAIPGMTASDSLDPDQENLLCSYLSSGGNLYLEQHGKWQKASRLKDLMHVITDSVYGYSFPEISGIEGTFTTGMNFGYPFPLNQATFDLVPDTLAYGIFSSEDHFLQVAHSGEKYRSIASVPAFGFLSDTEDPSTRLFLMKRYLEFFGIDRKEIHCLFHASDTRILRGGSIQFTDDSFDSVVAWRWTFPGGSPPVSDIRDPQVTYPEAGFYDVLLEVSDGTDTVSLRKKYYIRVDNFTGVDEDPYTKKILLYPNPASGRVFISHSEISGDAVEVSLYDLNGSKVRDVRLENGSKEISLSGLKHGLYLVLVRSSDFHQALKLMIR